MNIPPAPPLHPLNTSHHASSGVPTAHPVPPPYLLMITAPLYMTEKVGMLTWSRFSVRTHGRSLGAPPSLQPSAVSQQPHAGASTQAASNSTPADRPLQTSPPSPSDLISYITKVAKKWEGPQPAERLGMILETMVTFPSSVLFLCLFHLSGYYLLLPAGAEVEQEGIFSAKPVHFRRLLLLITDY